MTLPKEESFLENRIIDPSWVISYLETNLPSEKVNSELLLQKLKKMSRRLKGIKVSFVINRKIKNCFVINGYYDKDQKRSIEIEICSSALKKKINLSKKEYRSLIYEIADTLCHESLHRYQFQFKDYSAEAFKDGTEAQLYFGDQDEIFCYSVNIAHNLYRLYGINSIKKLQDLRSLTKQDPYLSEYYSLFYNQPQFKKVMKSIYLNILAIDQGKILHRDIT